jgi:hypothetical protein
MTKPGHTSPHNTFADLGSTATAASTKASCPNSEQLKQVQVCAGPAQRAILRLV